MGSGLIFENYKNVPSIQLYFTGDENFEFPY